jgi:hypothetical protein
MEENVQDFEKLGVFYLGRPYDLGAKKPKGGLLLYDSKDLVTHAVCIGMTGSGKTGLCLSLLEEALIDGIPAILIDPKGDLANLLLTFPDLRAEDFAPWINEDDARKKGLTPAAYAEQQADLWKKGLAAWGQDGRRIKRLRDAADFAIYTPGSSAGLPVSILKSFGAPPETVVQDGDLLRERINTTAMSLLGLLGVEADPIRSREHILVSKILESAWKEGRDLELSELIQQIQTPPLARIGALHLDSFYPSKDRFGLATLLNNLLAAPGFDVWLEGEALDIGAMLHAPDGRPRASIFSIAHLSDAERMFFVSLLLNETLGWVRTQSGTSTLRAIVYMDEIFGYFPPVANPPSKQPLLALLKQARAFGVGIVLATQNPVDLDYKGLANTGTWFIGRLQTERDKARVLDGLEGVAAGTGMRFDRKQMEQVLAGLGSRVFLLNNVHDDAPEIFETRWAMSYLRGPLTRTQIKRLMEPLKSPAPATPMTAKAAAVPPVSPVTEAAAGTVTAAWGGRRPLLPPEVPQCFLPLRGGRQEGAALVYRPVLLGAATVRFVDAKAGVDATQDGVWVTPITAEAVPVHWDKSTPINIAIEDVERSPQEPAEYAELPATAGKARNYEAWSRAFTGWLYGSQRLDLLKRPGSKECSRPGESERDFRVRLQEAGHEQRDRWADQLRQKYAPKVAALEERLRRAQQAVERETEQAKQQQLQTAISIGATLLGGFLGRKVGSTTNIGRATTAARGAGRILKERQDIGRAEATVQAVQQQLSDLNAEFTAEMASLASKADPLTERLESVAVKPKKADISPRLVTLAWLPQWRDPRGKMTPAWQ